LERRNMSKDFYHKGHEGGTKGIFERSNH